MLVGTSTSHASLARCKPLAVPNKEPGFLSWANRPHDRT